MHVCLSTHSVYALLQQIYTEATEADLTLEWLDECLQTCTAAVADTDKVLEQCVRQVVEADPETDGIDDDGGGDGESGEVEALAEVGVTLDEALVCSEKLSLFAAQSSDFDDKKFQQCIRYVKDVLSTN